MSVELKSVVELSAEVTQITKMKKHSVYKRMEKTYGSSYEIRYGIVLDVLSNGEDTVVEAFEYKVDYSGVSSEKKVFSGDSSLKIFPAEIQDVKEHFETLIESADKEVQMRIDQLAASRDKLQTIKSLAESMSNWNEGTVVTKSNEQEQQEIVAGEVDDE